MKKRILSFIVVCMMATSCISAFAAASGAVITIEGTQVEIPENMGSLKEFDDRVFVPVRFVSEYLGCVVKYNAVNVNGKLQENVTITDKSGVSYLMTRGSEMLYILPSSGDVRSPIKMDTAMYIDDTEGRTYIPIRFLAEALGYEVGWNADTETVSLSKK